MLQLSVPTLVLWGRNDEILDPKMAERIPEQVPGSQLVYVDRCGHSPHLEQSGIVASHILEFIKSEEVDSNVPSEVEQLVFA